MSEGNFHFVNAHVRGNPNIQLTNAKNAREVIRLIDEKDFNYLFAKS